MIITMTINDGNKDNRIVVIDRLNASLVAKKFRFGRLMESPGVYKRLSSSDRRLESNSVRVCHDNPVIDRRSINNSRVPSLYLRVIYDHHDRSRDERETRNASCACFHIDIVLF